jgi:hypothetical protein
VSDLIEFLRARLDDDERVARQMMAEPGGFYLEAETAATNIVAVAAHVYRWTPKRALAEVDAKRRILDEIVDEATGIDMQLDGEFRVGPRDRATEPYLGDTLAKVLALPYADHPGYREEWRP